MGIDVNMSVVWDGVALAEWISPDVAKATITENLRVADYGTSVR